MKGMFAVIGAYIKNIALIMLLAILAEMTVPDAKIKKYVSVTIGIVMIFAVGGKVFSILGVISDSEVYIPVFNMEETKATETEDIRERLTNILYEEMSSQENEVDNNYENNNGLDIKVEKVAPYKQNTNGEVEIWN
jgi:stage III sporulation protein AF